MFKDRTSVSKFPSMDITSGMCLMEFPESLKTFKDWSWHNAVGKDSNSLSSNQRTFNVEMFPNYTTDKSRWAIHINTQTTTHRGQYLERQTINIVTAQIKLFEWCICKDTDASKTSEAIVIQIQYFQVHQWRKTLLVTNYSNTTLKFCRTLCKLHDFSIIVGIIQNIFYFS